MYQYGKLTFQIVNHVLGVWVGFHRHGSLPSWLANGGQGPETTWVCSASAWNTDCCQTVSI